MSREYPAQVDVVIVGSGPTGAAYARILSETAPNATIAMFEVGPIVSDPPGSHVKNILDPAERAQAQSRSEGPGEGSATLTSPGAVKAGERRGRAGTFLLQSGYKVEGEDGMPVAAFSSNVGGMGAHWTAACPRPGGAERPDFLDDLDELLSEGERLLGVRTDAFDGYGFGDVVREHLAAALDADREPEQRVQPMPLAVRRREDGRLVWTGSDVVFGDVTRSNGNFSLFDESLVTRVLVEDGRAVGVEVEDRRSGTRHEVRSRFVVVAADALRTPQVLWASGVRPAALGRMLNDQTQIVYATRLRDVEPRNVGAEFGSVTDQTGVSWVPYTDEMPFHGQVMQLDASPIPIAEDDPVVPGSIVGLGVFCAKDLQWDDRVAFDDSAVDYYGMPSMTLHYTLTEKDHVVLDRAREFIVRMGVAAGDPIGDRPFTLPYGSSLHYQGSTRMGAEDDGLSVCSSDSEVWSVDGLFLAGNGVIPTPIACNPTLTSVALAVRGAREIAARLAA
ncbi:GMC oxidoreductase [Naasia lichenicola]|uniref:FAD-binding protein n=1 Tax=Naasia lichenicola TaxID=2565933 RepID=A0A4S4FPX3_9MICO|nr:GMC oxidoreductase [Naasia lichenicola]THG31645.1 FAD-binding protein [Naasia lichenicola]